MPSPPSNLIGFPVSQTSVYLSWLLPRKSNGILTHHTIYFRYSTLHFPFRPNLNLLMFQNCVICYFCKQHLMPICYRMIDKTSDSFETKRTVPGNVDYYEENGLDLSNFKYVFWVTSSNRMGESQTSSQLVLTPPPKGRFTLIYQNEKFVKKIIYIVNKLKGLRSNPDTNVSHCLVETSDKCKEIENTQSAL